MGPNEQLLLIGVIYFLIAGLAYLIIVQKSKNQVSETKFVTEQLLIYVVMTVCFYFHNYLLSLLASGILSRSLWELGRLFNGKKPGRLQTVACIISVIFLFEYANQLPLIITILFLILSSIFATSYIKSWLHFSCVLVLCTSFLSVLFVSPTEQAFLFLFLTFILVECFDSTAFIFGKRFGNIRLFKSISANKTIEGYLCGFVVTFALATITNFTVTLLPWEKFYSVYFFIVLFGVIGDLFFSHVKRCTGTKDFPIFMTSQGGIIDIFDSFLIAVIANFLISFFFHDYSFVQFD